MQKGGQNCEDVTNKWLLTIFKIIMTNIKKHYNTTSGEVCYKETYYLAGHSVRLANLVTPVSSPYRHH
jgi:hypothetical protein